MKTWTVRVTAIFKDDNAKTNLSIKGLSDILAEADDVKIVEDQEVPVVPTKKKKTFSWHMNKDMNVPECIMSHYTTEGTFTRDNAEAWLSKEDYNPSSASPALSRLKKLQHVESLGNKKFKFKKPWMTKKIIHGSNAKSN